MHFLQKYTTNRTALILICGTLFTLLSVAKAWAQPYKLADTVRVKELMVEAFALKQSSPVKALNLAREAQKISKAINWTKGVIKSTRVCGLAYLFMGDTKNALLCLEDALSLSIATGRKQDEAIVLYSICALYNQVGNFEKSFDYGNKALAIQTALKDSIGMADSYSSLGVILTQQKLFEKSNYYYRKAIEFYRIQHEPTLEAQYLGYIATNYMDMKNYPEAFRYFRQSLSIEKMANTYTNLGNYYTELQQYDSGMYYFNLALPIYEADSQLIDAAKSYENIAAIEMIRGNLARAEELLLKALKICRDLSSTRNIGIMEDALSEVYARKKEFRLAYQHHKEATKLMDSVLNAETSAKMAEYATRFEVADVSAHNKSLQKENELQKLKIQRDHLIIYGAAGMLLLIVVVGFLYFRQNKLKALQEKTELEQKQLRAQMNPHFIFNCLNSIQHFVVAGDVMNANKYLTGFAQLMRQTLEHSRQGTITLSKELVYLGTYIELESVRFENKFTTHISCADDINPDVIEIPSMIIQPFIENAIRHGLCFLENVPGVLNIRFFKQGSFLMCEIEDNGIGRAQSQKLKAHNHVIYESHGMELTRRRLELVSRTSGKDYTIAIKDKTEKTGLPSGTLVTIKFPLCP
jgi:tetratricopeptide (TPR) repeat protein